MISATGLSPAEFKAACNRVHAMRRASERFGLDFDAASFAEFESIVRAGASEICRPLKPDYHEHRTLYGVQLGGKWYPVVFDDATDSIVTFPPERALWPYYAVLMPVVPAVPSPALSEATKALLATGSSVPFVDPLTNCVAEIPALPESPTIAEITAAMKAARVRKAAIMLKIKELPKADWRRQHLNKEHDRLNAFTRNLKAKRIDLHNQINSAMVEIPEVINDDPLSLLLAAYGAIHSMGERLGWDITDSERAVQNAVQVYLTQHTKKIGA